MKPKAWSFSAIDKFDTCPRQYYETTVAKSVSETPSAEMLWGNRVHKSFEMRVKEGTPLLDELSDHEPYLEKLATRRGETLAEQKIALDTKLKPCAFFGKDVWFRGIIDYSNIHGDRALLVDYKTGKPNNKKRQLALFAIHTFVAHPAIMTAECTFYWTKDRTQTTQIYTRSELPELWKLYTPSLKQFVEAFQTDTWQPRPSGLCNGWCPVVDCEHWKPKRNY